MGWLSDFGKAIFGTSIMGLSTGAAASPLVTAYGERKAEKAEEERIAQRDRERAAVTRLAGAKATTGQGTLTAAQRAASIGAAQARRGSTLGGATGGRGVMDLMLALGKTKLGS